VARESARKTLTTFKQMTMAPTRKPGKQGDVMQIKDACEAENLDSLSSGPSSSDECVCDASSAKLGDVSENGDDKMICNHGTNSQGKDASGYHMRRRAK